MTTINSNIQTIAAFGSTTDKASLVTNLVQATQSGDLHKLLAAGTDTFKLVLFYAEVIGKSTGNKGLVTNAIVLGNQLSSLQQKIDTNQAIQLGDVLGVIGGIADFGGDLALLAGKVPVLAPILPEINALGVTLKASSVLIGYITIAFGSLTISEKAQIVDATRNSLDRLQQSSGSSSNSITLNLDNNQTILSNNAVGSDNASISVRTIDNKTIVTRLNVDLQPSETTMVYTVQSGDNLTTIAQQNHTTVVILQAYNPQITDPSKILAGEKIAIPLAIHNIGNTWTVGANGLSLDLILAATGIDNTPINLEKLRIANPLLNLQDLHVGETVNLGTPNSLMDLTIHPDFTPIKIGPSDPTQSISANNNTLLVTGDYTVGGIGNVNTGTGVTAWINDLITAGLRPGSFNLSPNGTGIDFSQLNNIGSNGPGIQINANALNNAMGNLAQYIPTDPLVLDLNGDGVHLTDYGSAPVLFDIDHDGGSKEQTGWVSAQDGIVVMDLNHNGKIDDISETLSEYFNGVVGTGGNAGTKPYANGLAALKSLDSNADNQFTSADGAAWGEVKVWQDTNHDGITDVGELKTLDELGITAINLTPTVQSGLVRDGNEILASSTFTQIVNGQSVTKEALAANFIANPNGSSFSQSGTGTITTTEGNLTSYTAADPLTGTAGEIIDVAQKGVNNAIGGSGNDTLIGDATNNWLAGGLGADSINAGAGDDVILFDALDTIDGGDGNDIAQVIGDTGVVLNLAQSHIEAVVGGRGDDILIGGGRSSVFIKAGDGNDIMIGGAANDVLSGENGDDLIDGGAGNDLMRGGRGNDQLLGGTGDDILIGGQDDDTLNGGAGNDVLKGEQGDDHLDGGDGINTAQFSGSFADYRISQLSAGDASTPAVWRVVDTHTGRDGADTLTNINKVSFADVSGIDLNLSTPLPVNDTISITQRSGSHNILVTDLLANDRNWDGSALNLSGVADAKGGKITGAITASGTQLKTRLMTDGSQTFWIYDEVGFNAQKASIDAAWNATNANYTSTVTEQDAALTQYNTEQSLFNTAQNTLGSAQTTHNSAIAAWSSYWDANGNGVGDLGDGLKYAQANLNWQSYYNGYNGGFSLNAATAANGYNGFTTGSGTFPGWGYRFESLITAHDAYFASPTTGQPQQLQLQHGHHLE